MEEYCIRTLDDQYDLPWPIPLAVRHVFRQRTLRRERARSVNGGRIQAEIINKPDR